MKLFVRIKTHYNKKFYYPDCEVSKLFCQLTGTKTLTIDALKTIKMLGYQICCRQLQTIELMPANQIYH